MLLTVDAYPACSEAAGKHTGPVWQLRWIEKERGSSEERVEVLVSVSTDGRVTQWAIRKGFESYGSFSDQFTPLLHFI